MFDRQSRHVRIRDLAKAVSEHGKVPFRDFVTGRVFSADGFFEDGRAPVHTVHLVDPLPAFPITTVQVRTRLERAGYRNGGFQDLIVHAATSWNGRDWVAALGSSWLDDNGCLLFPCLCDGFVSLFWDRIDISVRTGGIFWDCSRACLVSPK